MTGHELDLEQNRARMAAGELYYAFTPDLNADRRRCSAACERFNRAGGDVSRRALALLVKEYVSNPIIPTRLVEERDPGAHMANHTCVLSILKDDRALPDPAPTPREDEKSLADEPWIDGPVKMDYGYNVK